jgi:hypothetical protein
MSIQIQYDCLVASELLEFQLYLINFHKIYKRIWIWTKLFKVHSQTNVVFTKFSIIISIHLLSIVNNIFKLKFVEFNINWTGWLKWKLELVNHKS